MRKKIPLQVRDDCTAHVLTSLRKAHALRKVTYSYCPQILAAALGAPVLPLSQRKNPYQGNMWGFTVD